MKRLNMVMQIGYIITEPQYNVSAKGVPCINFRLLSYNPGRLADAKMSVHAFKDNAKYIHTYYTKGMPIGFFGKLMNRHVKGAAGKSREDLVIWIDGLVLPQESPLPSPPGPNQWPVIKGGAQGPMRTTGQDGIDVDKIIADDDYDPEVYVDDRESVDDGFGNETAPPDDFGDIEGRTPPADWGREAHDEPDLLPPGIDSDK